MTTTKTLTVPGDEWEDVRVRVVPHATRERSRPVLSGVQLRVIHGHRYWFASDSYTAIRLVGGETQAADCAVLIDLPVWSPAKPKPSTVKVTWNRTSLRAESPEWGRRTAPIYDPDVEVPDLPGVIERYVEEDGVYCEVAWPPESPHKHGALPLLGDFGHGLLANLNGDGWHKFGSARGVVFVAINDKLARRCWRSTRHGNYADMRVGRPLEPVVWSAYGVDVVQMPMREDLTLWVPELEEVRA